ncbi:MAG: hypothetical protein FJZ01_27405, partial [Candidatus Sericytochromatia bacterium]|nr:hypothetical protein [Candidatus Tanganyikabacteria bacterium]
MGLIEVIQEQVEIRALPRIWKTEHLLANPKIQGQFAEAGVRADPSNRSASPDGASTGVAVKDPGKSPYVRFKPGGKRGMYFCLRRHYLLGRDPAAFEEPFGFDPEQEYFDGSKWDGPHQGGSEPDSQDEPGAAGTDGLGGKAPIGPDRPFEPTPGPTAGLDDSSQRKAEAGAGSEASNGSAPSQDGGSRAGDSDRLFEKILKLVADGLVALPLGLLADLSLQLAKDPKTFELANWGNLLSLAGRLMRAAGKPRDAQLAFDQALRWFNGHPETDRRLILEVAPAFAELG